MDPLRKQPVRDERWTDRDGVEWQVAEIGKWRTGHVMKKGRAVPAGPYNIAFVVLRNIDGESLKISYPDLLADWTPVLEDGRRQGDPLAGRRAEVSRAVKAGKSRLTFEGESPVKRGETYHLTCGVITIGKVTTKANKRSEKATEVDIVIEKEDRDYFLRRTVPAANPREIVRPPTPDDIRKATLEGNYLSGAPDRGGDDLAVVPHDWVDRGAAEREARRQEQHRETLVERQAQAAKSRLSRLLRTAKTPEQALVLLAGVESLCRQAEQEREKVTSE